MVVSTSERKPIDAPGAAEREGVTVLVRRTIKPGCDEVFEQAMEQFVRFALRFPGHESIHVLKPGGSGPHTYSVVDKFQSHGARDAFKASPEYKEWMRQLGALSDGEPSIDELGGLSGWFTLPEAPKAKPPPKRKMAVVTFLGVYPLALVLPKVFSALKLPFPPLVTAALINVGIVSLLTWVVMPFLTRLFKAWLFPGLREQA